MSTMIHHGYDHRHHGPDPVRILWEDLPDGMDLGDVIFYAYENDDDPFQAKPFTMGADGTDPVPTLVLPDGEVPHEDPDYDYGVLPPRWESAAKTSFLIASGSSWTVDDGYDNGTFRLFKFVGNTKTLAYSRDNVLLGSGIWFFLTADYGVEFVWREEHALDFLDPATLTPPITSGMSNPSAFRQSQATRASIDDPATETPVVTNLDVVAATGDSTYMYGGVSIYSASPSGGKIIVGADNFPYTTANSGHSRQSCLLSCNHDGSGLTPLLFATNDTTPHEYYQAQVWFDQTDESVAYYSSYNGTTYGIGTVAIDGSGHSVIYNTGSDPALPMVPSPDGTKIAYSSFSYNGAVHVINSDGSGHTAYPNGVSSSSARRLAWNEDSDKIVTSSNDNVCLLDLGTGDWSVSFAEDDLWSFPYDPQWAFWWG